MRKKQLVILIFMAACLLARFPASGCPIPVYRYALEFWEADPYIVEIYHKGELGPQYSQHAARLFAASRGGSTGANLDVRMFDLDSGIDEVALGYIRRAAPREFPWVVVRYPRVSGISEPVWSGALTGSNVDMLLDSPVRREIGGKLAGGATAVWVFLESGDSRKDRASLDLLNRELRRLEQTLALPELELWVNGYVRDGRTDASPVITFEVARLSRSDEDEQHFISMLMGSEKDLGEFAGEPFVFPFYGRGIALWAIVGDGINEWNIRKAAEFLTGPCSCQAKLLNPGVDMLMAVDWDRHVERIADISLANPLSGMAGFTDRGEEVRRMLEEATIKRLGSTSRQPAVPETDPEKVVYIDISGESDTRRSEGTGAREEATSSGTQAETASVPGGPAAASASADPATSSDPVVRRSVFRDHQALLSETADTICCQATETGSRTGRYAPAENRRENIRESVTHRSSLATILFIFAAAIGAVILAGLIIYFKNIS